MVDKEKQIQEYQHKQLIDELSNMPPMVISTAYLHAINYTLYGEDVTEKWLTAVQQASALEKAYKKGYYDALQKPNDVLSNIKTEIEKHCGLIEENHCKYCSYCHSVIGVREIIEIIDKYNKESEQLKGDDKPLN